MRLPFAVQVLIIDAHCMNFVLPSFTLQFLKMLAVCDLTQYFCKCVKHSESHRSFQQPLALLEACAHNRDDVSKLGWRCRSLSSRASGTSQLWSIHSPQAPSSLIQLQSAIAAYLTQDIKITVSSPVQDSLLKLRFCFLGQVQVRSKIERRYRFPSCPTTHTACPLYDTPTRGALLNLPDPTVYAGGRSVLCVSTNVQ